MAGSESKKVSTSPIPPSKSSSESSQLSWLCFLSAIAATESSSSNHNFKKVGEHQMSCEEPQQYQVYGVKDAKEWGPYKEEQVFNYAAFAGWDVEDDDYEPPAEDEEDPEYETEKETQMDDDVIEVYRETTVQRIRMPALN
ncbi:uncharacterized protein PAC_15652 [Phialocephala subalpina]|uniref:Uncharacterized protein n=1 Tax=Phialocephala subalpina TaxID=576137 RepID=A0A1L7XL41_9HELO|nr:uncharacterized protein PAC_15652 [Phialocephala subalpina]